MSSKSKSSMSGMSASNIDIISNLFIFTPILVINSYLLSSLKIYIFTFPDIPSVLILEYLCRSKI